MPRGYLKHHDRQVGRKTARGGSSFGLYLRYKPSKHIRKHSTGMQHDYDLSPSAPRACGPTSTHLNTLDEFTPYRERVDNISRQQGKATRSIWVEGEDSKEKKWYPSYDAFTTSLEYTPPPKPSLSLSDYYDDGPRSAPPNLDVESSAATWTVTDADFPDLSCTDLGLSPTELMEAMALETELHLHKQHSSASSFSLCNYEPEQSNGAVTEHEEESNLGYDLVSEASSFAILDGPESIITATTHYPGSQNELASLGSSNGSWDLLASGDANTNENKKTAEEDQFMDYSCSYSMPSSLEAFDPDHGTSMSLSPPKEVVAAPPAAVVCAICLEEKQPSTIRPLMAKCGNEHSSACRDCLRTHYLKYAIQDPSNFPLKCFWASCTRRLRDKQIRNMGATESDMHVFYENENIARDMRRTARQVIYQQGKHQRLQERRVRNFMAIQVCVPCNTETIVFPSRTEGYTCSECQVSKPIDVITAADIKWIVDQNGDFIVNCPACHALIVKDGGCDHMTCLCHFEFSFHKEQAKLNNPT